MKKANDKAYELVTRVNYKTFLALGQLTIINKLKNSRACAEGNIRVSISTCKKKQIEPVHIEIPNRDT